MDDTFLQRFRSQLVVALVVIVAAVGIWALVVRPGSAPADTAAGDAVAADDGTGGGSASDADAAGAATDDAGADATSDRDPAPDVTLDLRDGGTVPLSDFEGTPVVLNFWASWCPPCVAEMGEALEPAHQEYGDEIAFLGINLQDEPDAAQRIVDTTGVTYDLALDEDGSLFRAFEGVGMPTTVFIDEQGRIAEHHTGILTPEQLEAQIQRLTGA